MSSTKSHEVTLEIHCSKCGQKLGTYKGLPFWILGFIDESPSKIQCEKCLKKITGGHKP